MSRAHPKWGGLLTTDCGNSAWGYWPHLIGQDAAQEADLGIKGARNGDASSFYIGMKRGAHLASWRAHLVLPLFFCSAGSFLAGFGFRTAFRAEGVVELERGDGLGNPGIRAEGAAALEADL